MLIITNSYRFYKTLIKSQKTNFTNVYQNWRKIKGCEWWLYERIIYIYNLDSLTEQTIQKWEEFFFTGKNLPKP